MFLYLFDFGLAFFSEVCTKYDVMPFSLRLDIIHVVTVMTHVVTIMTHVVTIMTHVVTIMTHVVTIMTHVVTLVSVY